MFKSSFQRILLVVCLTILAHKVIADGYVEYQPPFIPISITVSEDGVEISGSASISTPIGTFSAGYSHNINSNNSSDLILIIRHKNKWGDKVYKIDDGNDLSVFINGVTLVETLDGVVVVDVTNSKKVKIQFSKDLKVGKINKSIPMEFKVLTRIKNGDRFKYLRSGDIIKKGSKIKINFKVNKNSYVYIYHIKSTGLSQRLFPNSQVKNKSNINTNPIKSRNKIYLPSETESYALESFESNDEIYFIALENKDKKLENGSSNILEYISSHYGHHFNSIDFNTR